MTPPSTDRFLIARLLLGAIHSFIWSGSKAVTKHVGMMASSPGSTVAFAMADTSKPMDPRVEQLGVDVWGINFLMVMTSVNS